MWTSTGAAGAAPAPVGDRFQPELLVLAKVIVADPNATGWHDVTLEVLKVYCGQGLVPGSRFKGTFSDDGLQPNPFPQTLLSPAVKRGEVGIWWVERDKRTGEYQPIIVQHFPDAPGLGGWRSLVFPAPARNILGRRMMAYAYAQAQQWAGEVERVAKASGQERLRLWTAGALSPNPHIAAWSLQMLEKNCPEYDLVERCYGLLGGGRLSIAAQVAVEDLLCRYDARRWLTCERRARLLEHWVSGALTDELQACLVADRFHDALRQKQLTWKAWLPLMKKWVVTDCMGVGLEMHVFECYDPSLQGALAVRDEIVSYALGVLKEAADVEEKVFAAKWLVRVPPVTDKEVAIVKALQKKSGNGRIRDALAEALDASADVRRQLEAAGKKP
jgi:hypothetical protein